MFLRAIIRLLLMICFLQHTLTFTSDELRITLSNGSKLVGRYLRAYSGRPIKAFTNIPYAKPPVGPLRFKNPEPLEKWDDEYKAIEDGPVCPQHHPFIKFNVGDEDCLRLNVYVPHSFNETLSNLTTMVHIHGGGFFGGSGNRAIVGPDHFLDHDVILVTGNYRLGVLGFLSTEDANCPGNFGLKDQVMILKWVQENIKQFGGNPNSVTIFGESAGAASVTYLMASPLAQGLFSKGISSSGTNVASWAQSRSGVARLRAIQLAKHFNCLVNSEIRLNWPATINCIREIPANNLSTVIHEFYELDVDKQIIFTPIVEPYLPGAFITEHPRNEISDHAVKIPFLTGINYDEGLIKSAAIFNMPGLFEKFTDNMYHTFPIIFYYNHCEEAVQKQITDNITEFYFQNNFTRNIMINITNLIGDELYLSALDFYLRLRLSRKEVSPTYVYLLTHRANISYTAQYEPNNYYGVSHGDENIYLFPSRMKDFPKTLPTKDEDKIRQSMVQMWVNFAKTGNPTPESTQLPKWDKVSGFPINFYRIGNYHFEDKPMFGMETGGLFENRAQFWREIQSYLQNETITIISQTACGTINISGIIILSMSLCLHFLMALFAIIR